MYKSREKFKNVDFGPKKWHLPHFGKTGILLKQEFPHFLGFIET